MWNWERLSNAVRLWGNYTAWLLQGLRSVQSRLGIILRLYQQLLAHAPSFEAVLGASSLASGPYYPTMPSLPRVAA